MDNVGKGDCKSEEELEVSVEDGGGSLEHDVKVYCVYDGQEGMV